MNIYTKKYVIYKSMSLFYVEIKMIVYNFESIL